jgi:hypothetical protein
MSLERPVALATEPLACRSQSAGRQARAPVQFPIRDLLSSSSPRAGAPPCRLPAGTSCPSPGRRLAHPRLRSAPRHRNRLQTGFPHAADETDRPWSQYKHGLLSARLSIEAERHRCLALGDRCREAARGDRQHAPVSCRPRSLARDVAGRTVREPHRGRELRGPADGYGEGPADPEAYLRRCRRHRGLGRAGRRQLLGWRRAARELAIAGDQRDCHEYGWSDSARPRVGTHAVCPHTHQNVPTEEPGHPCYAGRANRCPDEVQAATTFI